MKKIVLIILSIILLIIIGIILFNTIILNNNEKEVLAVLKDLDYSLQNPKNEEENTYSVKPSEPTTLKEYIKTIYEARKFYADNGHISFFFKVGLNKEDNSEYETIIMVSNGELVGMTIDEDLLDSISNDNTEEDDFTINLTSSLQKAFFNSVNKAINEHWENATVLENINFTKILRKI